MRHALHRRFQSFFPQALYELLLESPAGQKDLGKRMRGIPALYNIDERLRVVESFPDYTQVLCLGMPSIDRLVGPETRAGVGAPRQRWPRRDRRKISRPFRRLRRLAADERAGRGRARKPSACLKNGANAIQLHTNIDGAPIDQDALLPIYEIIEKSGKPILLHPIRTREMADYRTEDKSKYEICSVIGWPFETGAALARLVFSGIMDRYPEPEGDHAPPRRHHSVFRRPRGAQLGPVGRAHVG